MDKVYFGSFPLALSSYPFLNFKNSGFIFFLRLRHICCFVPISRSVSSSTSLTNVCSSYSSSSTVPPRSNGSGRLHHYIYFKELQMEELKKSWNQSDTEYWYVNILHYHGVSTSTHKRRWSAILLDVPVASFFPLSIFLAILKFVSARRPPYMT